MGIRIDKRVERIVNLDRLEKVIQEEFITLTFDKTTNRWRSAKNRIKNIKRRRIRSLMNDLGGE